MEKYFLGVNQITYVFNSISKFNSAVFCGKWLGWWVQNNFSVPHWHLVQNWDLVGPSWTTLSTSLHIKTYANFRYDKGFRGPSSCISIVGGSYFRLFQQVKEAYFRFSDMQKVPTSDYFEGIMVPTSDYLHADGCTGGLRPEYICNQKRISFNPDRFTYLDIAVLNLQTNISILSTKYATSKIPL